MARRCGAQKNGAKPLIRKDALAANLIAHQVQRRVESMWFTMEAWRQAVTAA